VADEKCLAHPTGVKREAITAKIDGVKNLVRRMDKKSEKQPLLF
jgi:hypothetical protein